MAWTPSILSGSTNGRGIIIPATSSPGTLLHTAVNAAGQFDQIRLYFINRHTESVILTLEWGGTSGSDQIITVIPYKQGPVLEAPSFRLAGGLVVRAFANVTNVINVFGGVETWS